MGCKTHHATQTPDSLKRCCNAHVQQPCLQPLRGWFEYIYICMQTNVYVSLRQVAYRCVLQEAESAMLSGNHDSNSQPV